MTRKILNLILLTVLALSIIPFVSIPTVSAQEEYIVYKVKTTRDLWGNIWYYVNFTVTVEVDRKITNVTLRIYFDDTWKGDIVVNDTWAVVEYYAGKWLYKFNMSVDGTGTLRAINVTDGSVVWSATGLKEDVVVKIVAAVDPSKYVALTFKHIAPKLTIRSEVPYPLNMTMTKDWKIEAPDLNKDPYTADKFNATVKLVVYTHGREYPIDATVNVTFVETDVNSGSFEPSDIYVKVGNTITKVGDVSTLSIYNYTLLNCTNAASISDCKLLGFNVTPYDSNAVDVVAEVPYYNGSEWITETVTARITNIFSVAVPEMDVATATIKNVTILISDYDENRDSTEEEKIFVNITGADGKYKEVWAKETGKNTGVFKVTLDIFDLIKDGLIAPDSNELKVETNTTYFNAVATNLSVAWVDLGKVTVTYHTASINVSPTEIVLPQTGKPLYITVTIKDEDLDITSDVDMYNITVSKGDIIFKTPLTPINTKYKDIILAELTIYACKGDTCTNVTVEYPATIVFYEVEPGVLQARINLGIFNWTTVESALDGTPTKIEIILYDLYRADLKPEKGITAEIEIVKAKMSVDRTVIPMSDKGVELTIKVKDLAAAGLGTAAVEIKVYNYTGDLIGTYSVNLKETGIQTGEFEKVVTIRFDAENNKLLIDGTAVADASAALDGKLVIVYTRVPETKVEIPIKAYDADIKINGTTTLEVKYGDVIEIVVKDMDKDTKAGASNDEFYIMVGGKEVTLKETDEEGVFKVTVTVDGEIGDPGTVEITYTDPISTATTTKAIRSAEYKVTLKIKAFTGELYVNDSPEEITVAPVGKLIIKVVDPDLNRNPEEKDTIADYKAKEYRLVIMKWDGTEVPIESCAKETGASTGIFICEYDLSKLGSVSDILEGGIIQVVYVDPFTEEGVAISKTVIVKFKAENAVIETDKDEYEVGEWIYITVKDPDRVDVDFVTVYVWSDSYPLKIPVRLVKVEPGVFEGRIHIAKSPRAGEIYAKPGDKIYIKYVEPFAYIEGEIKKDVERVKSVSVKVVVPIKYPLSVPKPEEVPEKVKFFSWTKMSYVTEIKVGDIVSLAIPVKNIDTAHRVSITAIVIVYKDGVPVDVKTTRIVLAPGEETTVFVDLPKFAEPGTYTVKVLFWKEILTPATEEKIELTITVTK